MSLSENFLEVVDNTAEDSFNMPIGIFDHSQTSLDIYLKQMRAYPRLSAEETRRLAKIIHVNRTQVDKDLSRLFCIKEYMIDIVQQITSEKAGYRDYFKKLSEDAFPTLSDDE